MLHCHVSNAIQWCSRVSCKISVVEFGKNVECLNTKKCDNRTRQHFFRACPLNNAEHAEDHSHSTKEQCCRHFQFRINNNLEVLEYIITLIHTPALDQVQWPTINFYPEKSYLNYFEVFTTFYGFLLYIFTSLCILIILFSALDLYCPALMTQLLARLPMNQRVCFRFQVGTVIAHAGHTAVNLPLRGDQQLGN